LPELHKGFFPFKKFNENPYYDGITPGLEYYGGEFFSFKKYNEFIKFYANAKDKHFNMQSELKSYCWSDVMLLANGMNKFRKDVIESTKIDEQDSGVDPFQVSITIASLCNHIFRRNNLEKGTIAVIPEKGYNAETKQSFKALNWLKFVAENDSVNIKHARNGGEFKLGDNLIDGIDEKNKKLYEFNGCYYHGCNRCYNSGDWNNLKYELFGTTYSKHLFIPLLPSKINNKLVFALCAACAEQQLDKCNHNT